MIRAAAALSPGARRALLTISTMTATIMQALDTTIANVALPYMQGSLSASLDQVSWVLTSYIVAAAVMTAPVGWPPHGSGNAADSTWASSAIPNVSAFARLSGTGARSRKAPYIVRRAC